MPQEANICIFDHRKSFHRDNGEFHSEGVSADFCVELHNYAPDEIEYLKESQDVDFKPWVAMCFDNDDYDDDGNLILEV